MARRRGVLAVPRPCWLVAYRLFTLSSIERVDCKMLGVEKDTENIQTWVRSIAVTEVDERARLFPVSTPRR